MTYKPALLLFLLASSLLGQQPQTPKAGVPTVEHTEPRAWGDVRVQPGYTVNAGPNDAITVSTPETTVVKLSDEEYAKLQALRQAVVDEEKRLAVQYGAVLQGCVIIPEDIDAVPLACPTGYRISPDHYEFHQKFLLIDHSIGAGIRSGIDVKSPRVKFMDSLPNDSDSGAYMTPKGAK